METKYDSSKIGAKVLVRHVKTGEQHFGVVDDVTLGGFIVEVGASAWIFFDDDNRTFDTRFDSDRWLLEKFIP